ncbi:DNA-binding GntR family transcriptional regulator [Breznakia sp. PF5-3]|uniref:GntR family transcriptional regulator n=1 Tax=unclassified Breznakia TaxID=2623764 RepID=UPI002405FBE0|nr:MULTISPECIES: UTRA domain-containing protein [unclassified Breznakia]MDL2276486.1 GntR family transcriptional regulator [Breznakia sp. OttesenSCG-928-G09]MDF9824246.1 DNA-binding GntR family transcriptional regulator [Breznakia sp. PM6-1]MDF9835187.1 DNA-binding GntR family transcriptional regulator [Breznakia sp. PF5-3]MDF9837299.1 DNA-binding GntR family transcriptional regulator [Breznakia sp. PFB2-8]MDF9859434.1 DNA-binding GntR family transcriptional regulator [Breznakia sp. PH5-24]
MEDKDVYILKELDKFSSVTDAIKAQKLKYEYKVLKCEIMEANRRISKQLDLPIAAKIFHLEKVRIVEGKPRSIEKIYIDYTMVEGIEKYDFEKDSFYYILNSKYGIRTIRSEEEILIVDGTEQELKLLELDGDNNEVLLIKGRTFIDSKVSPLEYFEIVSLTSFYHFRSVTPYE